MKRALLALTLLTSVSAFAFCDNWSDRDTAGEAVLNTLLVADMAQTLDIKNHHNLRELNAVLGEHPKDDRIYGYFATYAASNALVVCLLPEDMRGMWMAGFSFYEMDVVSSNYKLKLDIKF